MRQINGWEKFPEDTAGIVKPTPETRSDLALDAALRVMAPLVEWLLQEGVTHSRLANALKQTFLDAAPGVLEGSATKVNDSSISTLTGIHRKDVREWRSVGRPLPPSRTFGDDHRIVHPLGERSGLLRLERTSPRPRPCRRAGFF